MWRTVCFRTLFRIEEHLENVFYLGLQACSDLKMNNFLLRWVLKSHNMSFLQHEKLKLWLLDTWLNRKFEITFSHLGKMTNKQSYETHVFYFPSVAIDCHEKQRNMTQSMVKISIKKQKFWATIRKILSNNHYSEYFKAKNYNQKVF